jgi:hypothetical protein
MASFYCKAQLDGQYLRPKNAFRCQSFYEKCKISEILNQFLVSHRNNTWGQCYITLHGRALRLFIRIPGKPFLPSLMFVGKARAYPSDANKAPALPANIRLGWKGLPGKNALAYYQKA